MKHAVTGSIRQHLQRVWLRHWTLQVASISVMAVVLMLMNFLFLGQAAFKGLISHWGRGLEMVVYLKESLTDEQQEQLRRQIDASGDFQRIELVSKAQATQKFLTSLGPESLELLKDPKWHSPIPSSFELVLSEKVPVANRLQRMQEWNASFLQLPFVEDVFYGQGWVENFSAFVLKTGWVAIGVWIFSVLVGFLVVGNCIRLSFLHRRQEIEILELIGASSRFIRTPFLIEGLVIGLLAALASLGFSYLAHSWLLRWAAEEWGFLVTFGTVTPLSWTSAAMTLLTGLAFGLLGAWTCVRGLNTGWAASKGL
jgi:cell division transport system permease protein